MPSYVRLPGNHEQNLSPYSWPALTYWTVLPIVPTALGALAGVQAGSAYHDHFFPYPLNIEPKFIKVFLQYAEEMMFQAPFAMLAAVIVFRIFVLELGWPLYKKLFPQWAGQKPIEFFPETRKRIHEKYAQKTPHNLRHVISRMATLLSLVGRLLLSAGFFDAKINGVASGTLLFGIKPWDDYIHLDFKEAFSDGNLKDDIHRIMRQRLKICYYLLGGVLAILAYQAVNAWIIDRIFKKDRNKFLLEHTSFLQKLKYYFSFAKPEDALLGVISIGGSITGSYFLGKFVGDLYQEQFFSLGISIPLIDFIMDKDKIMLFEMFFQILFTILFLQIIPSAVRWGLEKKGYCFERENPPVERENPPDLSVSLIAPAHSTSRQVANFFLSILSIIGFGLYYALSFKTFACAVGSGNAKSGIPFIDDWLGLDLSNSDERNVHAEEAIKQHQLAVVTIVGALIGMRAMMCVYDEFQKRQHLDRLHQAGIFSDPRPSGNDSDFAYHPI